MMDYGAMDGPIKPHATHEEIAITQKLFPLTSDVSLRKLTEFRIEFEKQNGPTDLNREYTSQLPEDDQICLRRLSTLAYVSGYPDFVIAYLEGVYARMQRTGCLDDASDFMVELYVRSEGQLRNLIAKYRMLQP